MKRCTGDTCNIKDGVCCCYCDLKDECTEFYKCDIEEVLEYGCSDMEEDV